MSGADEVLAHNRRVLEDRGGRPGFDCRLRSAVIARNAEGTRFLIGGLGWAGVGRMWVTGADWHPEADRAAAPVAPELEDDFGDTADGHAPWKQAAIDRAAAAGEGNDG